MESDDWCSADKGNMIHVRYGISANTAFSMQLGLLFTSKRIFGSLKLLPSWRLSEKTPLLCATFVKATVVKWHNQCCFELLWTGYQNLLLRFINLFFQRDIQKSINFNVSPHMWLPISPHHWCWWYCCCSGFWLAVVTLRLELVSPPVVWHVLAAWHAIGCGWDYFKVIG